MRGDGVVVGRPAHEHAAARSGSDNRALVQAVPGKPMADELADDERGELRDRRLVAAVGARALGAREHAHVDHTVGKQLIMCRRAAAQTLL